MKSESLVEYIKDSKLEMGHRVWQLRPPRPSVTMVVKGTFDPIEEGVSVLAEEQQLASGELYFEDDPERSLKAPSDYALLKPQGECFVIGRAWAPQGQAAEMFPCAFSFGSIRKEFAVIGDRQWERKLVSRMTRPAPCTEMELSLERAFGGSGFQSNPYGRGLSPVPGPDGAAFHPMPNLEQTRRLIDSPSSRPEPVIVGPLPPTWPTRMGYTGTYDQTYMQTRWPWLPADFDWRYFLEAPTEQRLKGFWRGDEPYMVQHLHPTMPVIRSRLPGTLPRVFLDIRVPQQRPVLSEVPMKLDTVVWDGDLGKLLLTWRGILEIPSETLNEIPHVFLIEDPLTGPQRTLADLQPHFVELLRLRTADETEAEGEAPPAAESVPEAETQTDVSALGEAETAVAEEGPEEPSPEELEFERKMAELQASLPQAPETTADAPELAPRSAADLRASMAGAGIPISPELESLLSELEEEESQRDAATAEEEAPVAEIPESPPVLEGRALVEARIQDEESLNGLDLTGADLSQMDLSGQDLGGAVLRTVSLAQTDLSGANLTGAILTEAELVHAKLVGAQLTDVDCVGANLQFADLSGAILEDADFEGARLVQAKLTEVAADRSLFTRAILTGATMDRGSFAEADFEEANLVEISAVEAKFTDAILERADASKAVFDRAEFVKARCEGIRAEEARFGAIQADDSFWERSVLNRCDFSLSQLDRADFSEAALVGIEFDGCSLKQARFEGSNGHSLKARRANLFETSFDGADVSFADFSGANLFGASLWRTKTDSITLTATNLSRTLLEQ